jgi:predicted dehydrogenase
VSVARIGIVGGGLMGRELAAAIGRWAALDDHPVQPRLEAVCDTSPDALAWFDRIPSVRLKTSDRRELLDDPDLDVLYLAVPHHLHEELYLEAIAAGKDFLGEKPFGIDLGAARRIVEALDASDVFARCSSEMPYFPGAQLAYDTIRSGALGQLIEVEHAFLHSSDLDRGKRINWKRQAQFCGANGVMNDLGPHVLHLPLRLGWRPQRVYAVLQDIVQERPGPGGELVPCDTWDNATLHLDARDEADRAGGEQHVAAARARHGRRRRLLLGQPEGGPALRRPRRPAGLGAPRNRQPVCVHDGDGRDLRVRVLRRDPADVGGLPGRARGRARESARLHDARRGARGPRAVRRGAAFRGIRRGRAGPGDITSTTRPGGVVPAVCGR